MTLLCYFLFPRLLCQSFVSTVFYLHIIFQSFSLLRYFVTDFWPSSSLVSKEVLLLLEKMKFAALASRASERPSAIQNSLTGGDPSPQLFSLPVVFLLSPSIVPFFYSIYWIQANQFPLSSVPFTLSSGFMIWQLCSPTNHPTVIAAKKVPFVLRLLPTNTERNLLRQNILWH